jgi:5-methylcytosine-specific restriction endonuclease McrA
MNTNNLSLAHLSDDQLLIRVKELVRQDRVTTARLLAHLAEMEERKLHCREGCSSLFTYCVEVLQLSEPAAYRRVKAARLAQRFPVVLDMPAEGSIHLAGLDVLAAHLTAANHVMLLTEARHKTKREVEEMVGRIRPLPDAPPNVRKLPEPQLDKPGRAASPVSEETITKSIFKTAAGEETTSRLESNPGSGPKRQPGIPPGGEPAVGSAEAAEAPVDPRREAGGPSSSSYPSARPNPNPAHRTVIAPLSPARYRIQFTAGAETYRKLRQVQELMRNRVPDGDPGTIVDTALTLLLEKLMREKTGATARPRREKQSTRKSGRGKRGRASALGSGEEKGEKSPDPGTAEARGKPPTSRAGRSRRLVATGQGMEDPRRRVAAGKPTESRHIPAAVKRAVWQRDQGQCAFTAGNGRRCSSRGPLEFHHLEPYMLGGRATIGNIALRCRAHNAYEAELEFGKRRSRVPKKKILNTPGTLPGESCGVSAVGIGGERRDAEARRGGGATQPAARTAAGS